MEVLSTILWISVLVVTIMDVIKIQKLRSECDEQKRLAKYWKHEYKKLFDAFWKGAKGDDHEG